MGLAAIRIDAKCPANSFFGKRETGWRMIDSTKIDVGMDAGQFTMG